MSKIRKENNGRNILGESKTNPPRSHQLKHSVEEWVKWVQKIIWKIKKTRQYHNGSSVIIYNQAKFITNQAYNQPDIFFFYILHGWLLANFLRVFIGSFLNNFTFFSHVNHLFAINFKEPLLCPYNICDILKDHN